MSSKASTKTSNKKMFYFKLEFSEDFRYGYINIFYPKNMPKKISDKNRNILDSIIKNYIREYNSNLKEIKKIVLNKTVGDIKKLNLYDFYCYKDNKTFPFDKIFLIKNDLLNDSDYTMDLFSYDQMDDIEISSNSFASEFDRILFSGTPKPRQIKNFLMLNDSLAEIPFVEKLEKIIEEQKIEFEEYINECNKILSDAKKSKMLFALYNGAGGDGGDGIYSFKELKNHLIEIDPETTKMINDYYKKFENSLKLIDTKSISTYEKQLKLEKIEKLKKELSSLES